MIVNEETGQISSFLALWMIAYDAAQAAAPRLLGPRASPRLRLGSKILVPIPSVLAEAARDTGRAGAQADGHAGRGLLLFGLAFAVTPWQMPPPIPTYEKAANPCR